MHKRPSEAAVQKVIRLQRAIVRAIEVAPGASPTPRIRALVKKLAKADKEAR
jgi:hypothetical protein